MLFKLSKAIGLELSVIVTTICHDDGFNAQSDPTLKTNRTAVDVNFDVSFPLCSTYFLISSVMVTDNKRKGAWGLPQKLKSKEKVYWGKVFC
jgi:hypothetical protein